MTVKEEVDPIVGRGTRDGAQKFRDWFTGLEPARARGEKIAYVFVMGSLAEVLQAFGIRMVFPEINALQTAVRRVAHEYLNAAEDYGFSPDICAYVKADVAMQLDGGRHPMGRIPPPSLVVTTNACNTYLKWVEIWERFYPVPTLTIDVPGSRDATRATQPGEPDFERDRRWVEVQVRDLIAACERLTGTSLDLDRLRESMGFANRMNRAWRRVLELNRNTPAPFSALVEGTVYLGMMNAFRGSAEGAKYFEDLVEEMEFKVAHGLGTVDDEKYRLLFVGVPCYPIFRRFNEMFTGWGGTFVNSTYLWFAAGGAHTGYQYDLSRPVESLAEGVLLQVRAAMDSMFHPVAPLAGILDDYHADGVVFHPIKSCRTTSTGMADQRRALMALRDLPSLLIESDMMDKRVVSEAQLKNRIDAFFESLATRKRQAAGREEAR